MSRTNLIARQPQRHKRRKEFRWTVERVRMAEQVQSGKSYTRFDPAASLERLHEYRKLNPQSQIAIAEFAEAEVTSSDPVEGVPVEEEFGCTVPAQT